MTGEHRILHVDMDAFYASVEERDDPSLRGKAVIVGGSPSGRGVVQAANYAARRYGVASAMPAARALRLCPHAVFVRPRMAYYCEVSASIREILMQFTPLVEPLALDEAFLDVTASERLFGPARVIARQIRDAVRARVGLAASVGVAGNKFLAKLACTLAKPDGVMEVATDAVQAFLDPLPVSRLWGVGEGARAALARIGIETVRELREADPARVGEALGAAPGRLLALARGEDPRAVIPEARARSLSHESTFERDIADAATLRAWAFALAEQVARRARAHGLKGRTVRVKIRYGDFRTRTRARTLEMPVNDTAPIAAAAVALLEHQLEREPGALRLLGVGLAGFDAPERAQGDLFAGDAAAACDALDEVADRIARRFGAAAVSRARTLDR